MATLGLLSVEDIRYRVWEPACGEGAISKVLEAHGLDVYSSDLADRGYGRPGVDFLTCRPRHMFDVIITNPPFTHMLEFARRAVELRPQKVCMIGRLLWLEGKHKKEFLETSGLSRVWVFSQRINIAPARYKPKKPHNGLGGMVAFAWYVWEPRRLDRRSPELGWIDVTKLKDAPL